MKPIRRPARAVGVVLTVFVVAVGLAMSAKGEAGADGDPLAELSAPVGDGELTGASRPTPARHLFPVISSSYEYGRSHHDYPATDVAVACGTRVVAVTDGLVWEVERSDRWNPILDVPSTRGGRTVVIDADDGARYLYAHFSSISSSLVVGQRVVAGETIGTVGSSGRSTGCHLHLGLSAPCPGRVWDLLAGSIWPWPYFDAWRTGLNVHPGAEIRDWLALHPEACTGNSVIQPVSGLDIGPDLEGPGARQPWQFPVP